MRYLLLVAVLAGCGGSEEITIEDACADQAEIFCSEPCFDAWDTCREDYTRSCTRGAQSPPTAEEHEECLEEMSEDENLCDYPFSVPSVCWF